MTDVQRFTELTGGCWHEYDKIIGLYNKCSCGKICGNLDEHIKQSNPTYSNAADILNRMKEFCGQSKYNKFLWEEKVKLVLFLMYSTGDVTYLEDTSTRLGYSGDWFTHRLPVGEIIEI